MIRRLKERSPGSTIYVRTTAPRWLLEDRQFGVAYSRQALDAGVIQRDSLAMDLPETLASCQTLHLRNSVLIQEESAFISRHGIELVVGDIPPLCFEIAARSGIPSVAIGNFSWSAIYRRYLADYPQFEPLIDAMDSFYRRATLALSLPYPCGFDIFLRSDPIPLITRSSSLDKLEARAAFDLPLSATIVLLSFGGLGLERLPLEKLLEQRDFFFVGTGPELRRETNLVILPEVQSRYVDLVQAADIIVSKPGYGIAADVIRHRVPLLYTDRGDFAEYPFLVKMLDDWATAAFIEPQDLISANLTPFLIELLEKEPNWPPVPTDGAEVACDRILNLTV